MYSLFIIHFFIHNFTTRKKRVSVSFFHQLAESVIEEGVTVQTEKQLLLIVEKFRPPPPPHSTPSSIYGFRIYFLSGGAAEGIFHLVFYGTIDRTSSTAGARLRVCNVRRRRRRRRAKVFYWFNFLLVLSGGWRERAGELN